MKSVLDMLWFIAMVINVVYIYRIFGYAGLTAMFPEGKRWWHWPIQVICLTIFGILCHYTPF